MRTTIDRVGRIVVPKSLRDEIGLAVGPVDVYVEGTRIVVEPIPAEGFVERDGMTLIPASGESVNGDMVRDLLDQGRR